MQRIQILLAVLLMGLLVVACAPKAAPAPAPVASVPTVAPVPVPAPVPAVQAKPAWEEKWEKTLAEAKKEGKVVFYTGAGAQTRVAMIQGLSKAYGISAEVIAGRATEIHTKVLTERRAGLYLWDHWQGGQTSALTQLKPAGVLDSLDLALILPDVTDPVLLRKIWYQGGLRWVDQDHTLLVFQVFPQPPLAINTNLIRPDEIKSYNDLLDPKWKGKISINDPTIAGSSFAPFMINVIGPEWLRKLVNQEPIIMRDQRLQVEWLARGKVPIAIGMLVDAYTEFKNLGAPIQSITPQEGTWLSAGTGGITIFNRPAHPNAAKVFINWLLSKEGQTIFSKASGGQSAREDVPTDHLYPEQMRQPGVKYWEKDREEILLKYPEYFNLCKEIFGPLMK